MQFDLDTATLLLSKTPKLLELWLCDLPATWLQAREKRDSWNIHEILGYLVYCEAADWMPRVQAILQQAAELPPFDENAQMQTTQNYQTGELLTRLAELRMQNLQTIHQLKLRENDLEKQSRHPKLGRVDLRNLLAAWTAHDLGHLAQISRVIARQYKDDSGPWIEYLPILWRH